MVELLDLGDHPLISTGTIKGIRMAEILTNLTTTFVEFLLGKNERFLEHELPSEEWPDVVFINNKTTFHEDQTLYRHGIATNEQQLNHVV